MHSLKVNRLVYFLAYISLVVCSGVRAELRSLSSLTPKEDPFQSVFRLELNESRSLRALSGKSLLPNRVHILFEQKLNRWVFSLTNASGKFQAPLQSLVPGTILPGSFLGADHHKRFLLTQDGRWVPSRGSSQFRVWVQGKNESTNRHFYLQN